MRGARLVENLTDVDAALDVVTKRHVHLAEQCDQFVAFSAVSETRVPGLDGDDLGLDAHARLELVDGGDGGLEGADVFLLLPLLRHADKEQPLQTAKGNRLSSQSATR
jgi:hypothetical protein